MDKPKLNSDAYADVGRRESATVPIVEEEAYVSKRIAEVEHVSIHTSADEDHAVLHEDVTRQQVEIMRVSVEREVDAPPPVRSEGEVTIIPVLEERPVVVKRLFLVEELHVRRSSRTEAIALPVTLRRTRVDIERHRIDEKESF